MTAAAARRRLEEFFGRPAELVAPDLLGSRVACQGVTVRLTEVEAYSGLADPASHAFRGLTRRTAVMFGPAAHVYVYFVYGAHWAMNLVCQDDGVAAAVLLRAGEVVDGEDTARGRRGSRVRHAHLGRGPGNLTSCLGVTGGMSGSNLWDGPVRWSPADAPAPHTWGPRVGVSRAADVAWRVWIPGDPTVSAYRRHTPRRG
ncbi:MAG: DNA-3-methyladenine glycosylase [Nocardioidaceae bacterium]